MSISACESFPPGPLLQELWEVAASRGSSHVCQPLIVFKRAEEQTKCTPDENPNKSKRD